MAQFEICISQGVIPKSPRFYQRVEGSPVAHSVGAGDPSLRLKNGSAQDDVIDGLRCHQKLKMSHYRGGQGPNEPRSERIPVYVSLLFAGQVLYTIGSHVRLVHRPES